MEKSDPRPASASRPSTAEADRPFSLSATPDFLRKTLALMADTARMAADRDMSTDEAVNGMLEAVGRFLNVSRAYVMLEEQDGRHLRNTHEWVNRDTGPAMFSWPLHDYEHDLPSLKPLLADRDFLAAHTQDLPPDLEQTLRKQGVDSVLLVPLRRGRDWIGLTGCDTCGAQRVWGEEEILLLRHLAHAAVFALDRGECRRLRDTLDRVRRALAEDEPGPAEGQSRWRGARREAYAESLTLRETERRLITDTLRRCRGNKQCAADQLGLTWAALDRRCKKLGIDISKT